MVCYKVGEAIENASEVDDRKEFEGPSLGLLLALLLAV